jgi:signal transduction histidine kinase
VALPRGALCSLQMANRPPYIAVVDDDQSIVKAWVRLLRSANFETAAFTCGEDFLKSVSSHPPDCLVLDVNMPGINGFQVQARLASTGYAIPIVFVTARYDDSARQRSMDAGAMAFLQKPLDDQTLLDTIRGMKKSHDPERQASTGADRTHLDDFDDWPSWPSIPEHENGSLLTQMAIEISSLAIELQKRKEDERQMKFAMDEMSSHLINSIELERGRIARELHDDLCQRLSLLSIGLEQLAQTKNISQKKLRSEIRLLQEDTASICSDAGRLSRDLHSCKLEQLGLVPTIRSLCNDLSKRHGVQIEFIGEDTRQTVPRDVALCLFRIAQDELGNAAKYSKAPGIHAELRCGPEVLRLRVEDAGVGFDPESVSGKGRLGLTSMRERTRFAGGEISIRSQPSHGTEIDVRIPLRKELPIPA